MSQAEDLLNSLTADDEIEEHIVIGKDRFITVPLSLQKIAVQYDNNVRTVTFDCPRYSDGRDLSTMIISINYMRPDGIPGLCQVDEVTIDKMNSTLIHFDWVIREHVTRADGTLSFLVCAKKVNSDGTNENHWNSELNQEMQISKGFNCTESIIEAYPDLITKILTRLDVVEKREVTKDDVENALGYIPQEYDQLLYKKYEGEFIHIPDTYEGTAKLINPSSELLNHTVTSCGKNLFNINGNVNVDLSTGEDRPEHISVENGILTANLSTAGYHPNGQRLYNLKGKTVSFSATCVSEDVYGYIGIYEDGNEEIFVTGQGSIKIEGYICKTDNPIFGFNTSGSDTGARFTNIQIEIGATKTDYEPYTSETITVTSDADEYSIKTYTGQTNIFNDCASSMTIMVSPTLSELEYEDSLSVKRRETAVSDANDFITTGYAKTEYGLTQNLPEQVYGGSTGYSSEWGVLFFIMENEIYKTGTQIFYPIDGPYRGRMFVRSLTNMVSSHPDPGNWSLLANESDVNASKEEANAYTDQNATALYRYIHSIIRPYELTWTDGYYISRHDGSVNEEEGSSYCDFVSVEPGTKLIISNTMTADTEYNAFYDSEQNFLSSFETNDGSIVIVPDGAKYFRLSKHTSDAVVVVPEIVLRKPKATRINLNASDWVMSEDNNLVYSQTVDVAIVTENSQIELRPSPEQLRELLIAEISLMAANDNGTVTVFAIGGAPTSDYSMQIIVSEVDMI